MKRSTRRGLMGLLRVLVAAGAVGALCGCAASSSAQGVGSASPVPAPSSSPTVVSRAAAEDPPMKTIGIIGGISWVSSEQYYRFINEMVRDRFGPTYSAPILMYSIPFGEFSKQERLAGKGDWKPLRATMVDAAQRLERGGADFIIVASNTMNSTDDLIEANVSIPVLNIVDAVGAAVQDRGIKTVALLGTKFTMEQPFYAGRLEGDYGLKVVTPNAAERTYINAVVFNQLCAGRFTDAARDHFARIIERLVREEGAQGVIPGCTEIPLLVKQKDVSVPAFDTTLIHSAAAVRYSLGEK
ncbi:MAG: aspartate/glutamate racemase family protein [Actinomycetes bacterium]